MSINTFMSPATIAAAMAPGAVPKAPVPVITQKQHKLKMQPMPSAGPVAQKSGNRGMGSAMIKNGMALGNRSTSWAQVLGSMAQQGAGFYMNQKQADKDNKHTRAVASHKRSSAQNKAEQEHKRENAVMQRLSRDNPELAAAYANADSGTRRKIQMSHVNDLMGQAKTDKTRKQVAAFGRAFIGAKNSDELITAAAETGNLKLVEKLVMQRAKGTKPTALEGKIAELMKIDGMSQEHAIKLATGMIATGPSQDSILLDKTTAGAAQAGTVPGPMPVTPNGGAAPVAPSTPDVDLVGGTPVRKSALNVASKKLAADYETLDHLAQIRKSFRPELLTRPGKGKSLVVDELSRWGVEAKGDWGKLTDDRNKLVQQTDQFFNSYRKEITGAAAAISELDRLQKSLLSPTMSPREFNVALDNLQDKFTRTMAIKSYMLRNRMMPGKAFGKTLDGLIKKTKDVPTRDLAAWSKNSTGPFNADPPRAGYAGPEAPPEPAAQTAAPQAQQSQAIPTNIVDYFKTDLMKRGDAAIADLAKEVGMERAMALASQLSGRGVAPTGGQ